MAQQRAKLTTTTTFHRDPGGTPLGTLAQGTQVGLKRSQGGWQEIEISGWVFTTSLGPAQRDGYDITVTKDGGENLRDAPDGNAIGRLRAGALFDAAGKKGGWTRVKRTAWVPEAATRAAQVSAKPPQKPDSARAGSAPSTSAAKPAGRGADSAGPTAVAPASPAPVETRGTLTRGSELRLKPDGPEIGTLVQGATTTVRGRSGGWVKVQVEGWVREDNLKVGEPGGDPAVTAADLRSSPDRYVGRQVEWRLQLISIEKADELRPEIPEGQYYLLTRGPLPEAGFVYVIVPPDQVATFRSMPALKEITVRGTIKAPRTRYLPTPVVELVSVVDQT